MRTTIIICALAFLLLFCLLDLNVGDIYARVYERSLVYWHNNISSGIHLSHRSGFYEEPFELSIYAPTDDIYYTLDGSKPSRDSKRYTGPIPIKDATVNENFFSSRTDTSAGFLTEEVLRYSPDINTENVAPCIKQPDFPVDKCTIIRAVYYTEDGQRGMETTESYFVGYQDKFGYDNIGVLSLVAEPEDLFGYENGIYVLGRKFDEYVANDGFTNDLSGYAWNLWDANYRQRGREWERPVTAQFFDVEKDRILSKNVGLRIQGGGSRGFVVKSLNLFAREEYDGDKKYRYDFWGNGFLPETVTLIACNGDASKMRDRLVSELSENVLSCSYRNFLPYAVFLNGEYWGLYYLTEKYDEAYLNHHFGVKKANVVTIKSRALEIGEMQDAIDFWVDFENIVSLDMSVDENYMEACRVLDMQSTIDYFAAEMYFARSVDWPENFANTQLWKGRELGTSAYEDGRWRWIIHDQNSPCMTADLTELNSLKYVRERLPFFDSLCASPDFRQALAEKMICLGLTSYSFDKVAPVIESYRVELADPMENHLRRFYGSGNESFHEGADSLLYFFEHRFDVVVDFLQQEFPDVDIGALCEKYGQSSKYAA